MSRPIKFRVWDTRKQAYTERCNDNLVFCTSAGSGDLGKYEAIVADLYDSETQCMEQVPVYYDGYQLILEQFTGLLDSKGVEIYEGDIVRWIHGPVDVGVAQYSLDEAFGDYPNTAFYGLKVARFQGICQFQLDDEYDVMGNIHQHPELLKT